MIKRQKSDYVELCLANKDKYGLKKVVVIFHSVQKFVGGLTYPVPRLNLPHSHLVEHVEERKPNPNPPLTKDCKTILMTVMLMVVYTN